MLGTRGARLEKLRWWVAAPLTIVALGPFFLAFIAGMMIAPFAVGLLFAFGLALSRPVSKNPQRDLATAATVYALVLAFIPIFAIWAYLDMVKPPQTIHTGFDEPFPWGPFAAFGSTVLGSLISAFAILRSRGPPGTVRRHLKTAAAIPFGIIGGLWAPGVLWYVSPILAFGPFALLLGHAALRIVKPAQRAGTAPPVFDSVPTPAAAPGYVAFGARRP